MADPVAVQTLRATADRRLVAAVRVASQRLGIPFKLPPVPDYEPGLKAARTIQAVAEFMERANAQEKTK